MKKIIIMVICLASISTGCDKEMDLAWDWNITISAKDYLTSGSWKLTDVVSDDDGNGTYETNNFVQFSSCYTDNFYTFKANNVLEMDEGPTKCSPSDPQISTSTWKLTNNDESLMMANDTYTIMALNFSTLKLKLALANNRSNLITFSPR